VHESTAFCMFLWIMVPHYRILATFFIAFL